MTKVYPSYAERSESDKHSVVNVKGHNVVVSTTRTQWGSGEGSFTDTSLDMSIPDLQMSMDTGDPAGKLKASEASYPKRLQLIREVEEYIKGQLGNDKYNFVYSTSGLVIRSKAREHEEARLKARDENKIGIPALDNDPFITGFDVFENTKNVSKLIKKSLEAAKRNPALLNSDEVSEAALNAAKQALEKEGSCSWFRHEAPRYVQYGEHTYCPQSYRYALLFAHPQIEYGISPEDFVKALKRFFVENDLEIGINARLDGTFHLEATPGAHAQLQDIIKKSATDRLTPKKIDRPGVPERPADGVNRGES